MLFILFKVFLIMNTSQKMTFVTNFVCCKSRTSPVKYCIHAYCVRKDFDIKKVCINTSLWISTEGQIFTVRYNNILTWTIQEVRYEYLNTWKWRRKNENINQATTSLSLVWIQSLLRFVDWFYMSIYLAH